MEGRWGHLDQQVGAGDAPAELQQEVRREAVEGGHLQGQVQVNFQVQLSGTTFRYNFQVQLSGGATWSLLSLVNCQPPSTCLTPLSRMILALASVTLPRPCRKVEESMSLCRAASLLGYTFSGLQDRW